jgi:hypothetical protein
VLDELDDPTSAAPQSSEKQGPKWSIRVRPSNWPDRCYVYDIFVRGKHYFGKGTNGRTWAHKTEAMYVINTGQKARKNHPFYEALGQALFSGEDIQLTILIQGLTDDEAFDREIVEIAATPPDLLWNIAPGGMGFDSATAKMLGETPEAKAIRSITSIKNWNDPLIRERMMAGIKAAHADPAVRTKQSAAIKAAMSTPEHQAVRQALWQDPDYRSNISAKVSATATQNWQDPQHRAKHLAAFTPEVRAQMSVAAKAARARPDVQARHSAALKITWRNENIRTRRTAGIKASWEDEDVRARRAITARRGSHHPDAKFDEQQIVDIRTAYATGETVTRLARQNGVSTSTIGAIVRGESWTHIGGPIFTSPQYRPRHSFRDGDVIVGKELSLLSQSIGISYNALMCRYKAGDRGDRLIRPLEKQYSRHGPRHVKTLPTASPSIIPDWTWFDEKVLAP